MTKIVDIINNQLVVDKQKLEFELEKLINNNTMDTEKRVEKSIETRSIKRVRNIKFVHNNKQTRIEWN